VRPGHLVSTLAEPALVIVPLGDSVKIHSRPPVAGPNLSRRASDNVPCLVQHGFLGGRRRGDLHRTMMRRIGVPVFLGFPEAFRDP